MHVGRHPRIAHGPQQNRVKIAVKHFHRIRRQRRPVFQIPVRAPVKFGQLYFPRPRRSRGLQHLHRLRDHFLANSVARNHRNPLRLAMPIRTQFRPHLSQRPHNLRLSRRLRSRTPPRPLPAPSLRLPRHVNRRCLRFHFHKAFSYAPIISAFVLISSPLPDLHKISHSHFGSVSFHRLSSPTRTVTRPIKKVKFESRCQQLPRPPSTRPALRQPFPHAPSALGHHPEERLSRRRTSPRFWWRIVTRQQLREILRRTNRSSG